MMKYIKYLLFALLLTYSSNLFAQTPQCRDGIDNDGDGRIDALTEVAPGNSQALHVGGRGDSSAVSQAVRDAIVAKRLSLTSPVNGRGSQILRADHPIYGRHSDEGGTLHLPTLKAVCRTLGYRTYVSSTCRELEGQGRCNYYSPGDNDMWRFVNGDFRKESATYKTWIATIDCRDRFSACSDGGDNDGDGLVDRADPGCASDNDDSEGMHDPECSNDPNGPSERTQSSTPTATPTITPTPTKTPTRTPTATKTPTETPSCNPNVSSGLVNFEEFSESANIAIEPYRSQILQKYGIQFDAVAGGNLAIAKVVNQGDSEPSFKAWLSSLCPGEPKNNRVCNGGSVGKRVLSMINAKDTKTAELSLTLVEPVQSLSFDIIDMDGGETWTVTATDRDGMSLPSQTVSSSGYGVESGNSKATNFQVKTLGREIKSVRIQGTKSINIFGFGFDNFVTGITCTNVQTTSQCQDTLDNDSDGVTDFPNDFSCTSAQDNDETNIKSQCQDGLDNDTDGLIDLLDPGCSNNQDNNEGNGTTQCQDGLDNDSDGAIDFPNDFSCTSRQDNDETNTKAQCQDGLDNDSDGLVDLVDPGCSNAQDNNEADGTSQCQDTLDNDSDGATDFPNDFSCTSRQDNDETNIKSQCQDGLDNDTDGLIDLLDPGCSNNQDNNEGNGTTQCQDTLDNDSDGSIDFPNDFSCTSAQDNDETNIKSQCQDGLDNDTDGLIDLLDPGCSNGQDNNEGDEALKLAVGVDCVLDNSDGTKTAFFSYNNSTAQTINIAVGSTTSPATKNEFSPGAPDRGQPTSFAPGIVKGAVGVPLSGGTITWSVRSQGGSVSTATASAASPTCARVQPLAECQGFDNGVLRVLGGYQNLNNFEVKIPIGGLNNFSPGNQNQGQPASFLAGLNKGTFNINLTNNSTVLMWTLNGLQAVASTALPICSGECVDTPVGSITKQVDQLAVQIAALTKQAAAILASAGATVAKTSKVSSKKRTRTQARIAASADRVDAERANAKANGYVTQSQELTIQIPNVIKNCPEAPQLCQTVDNGPTIDALRDLFAQARNTAKRTIARAYFRNTGATNRKDKLVAQAKSLEKQGLAQLDQIPRTSTECQ